MTAPDPWPALLGAWEAWTRTPGSRDAAVRLTDASRPVAELLGVPVHQVSTVLADAWREVRKSGGTQADAVALLRSRVEAE